MLHTYRKTALIEAEQFDGSIKQITRYKVHIVGPTSRGDTSYFLLPTKEGNMKLNAGDYIATGIDGEHWIIDKAYSSELTRGWIDANNTSKISNAQ